MGNATAFRVFLPYSLAPAKQALAWRLQTLAAAYGVEMYVPERASSGASQAGPPVAIRNAIDRSDCVLAIITAKANLNVQKELKSALDMGRLVIPIVHSEVVHNPLLAPFPHVFVFSAWDSPGKVEGEVLEFLKQQHQSKESLKAIGALGAVGVGLLLLSSLSEK
jgi:hypothetical protein